MSASNPMTDYGTPKATMKDFAIGAAVSATILGTLIGIVHFIQQLLG